MKKKVINILTIFFISHKSSIKIFPIKKMRFEFVQPSLSQVGGCQGTLPTQQKAKGFEAVVKNIE